MNLLRTLKEWIAPAPKVQNENLVTALQQICAALPGGRMTVEFAHGEFNLSMSWDTSGMADRQEPLAFSLSGRSEEVVVYDFSGVKGVRGVRGVKEVKGVKGVKEVKEVKEVRASDSINPLMEDEKADRCEARRCKRQKQMMATLEEHLAANYDFRYNLITEQTECARRVGEGQVPVYLPVDARMMNTVTYGVVREGTNCWDKDVKRIVESSVVREYHPFTLYFDTLPAWDGTDRVTPLARRVSSNPLWTRSFHRWMLATVAQWTGRNTNLRANSVSPLIISTRQGMGKSTFCRMLMPLELRRYFTESYDLNSPAAAEEKLATFGLINLDEFDKLSVKKMPLLKNLMQMETLNIRKAYKRSTAPLRRIASFIGTSNRRDLLTDTTGSRRFICIEPDGEIDCSPIDYAQLYAQLRHELDAGARYWFTKDEEAEIQRHNAPYYRGTPEEEIFRRMFRPAEADGANAVFMSATEIYEAMCRAHRKAMAGVSLYALSRLLPSLAQRVHTRYQNGYWVERV